MSQAPARQKRPSNQTQLISAGITHGIVSKPQHDLSPMAASIKNGMRQTFTFESDLPAKKQQKDQAKQRTTPVNKNQGKSQEKGQSTLGASAIQVLFQNQDTNDLHQMNQASQPSQVMSSSGTKPKKRLKTQQQKELLIQALNLQQQQLQQQINAALNQSLKNPEMALPRKQEHSDFQTSQTHSTKNGGQKKFDRLSLTTNLKGISSLVAQSTTHAGSSATTDQTQDDLTHKLLLEMSNINYRRGNGINTTTNTDNESCAISRIGDTSLQHSDTIKPQVVKRSVLKQGVKHLVLKSSDRTNLIKLAKKQPSEAQEGKKNFELNVSYQQPSLNVVQQQQTGKEKSKSFRAPAFNKAKILKLQEGEPQQDGSVIQPTTTTNQSTMFQKALKNNKITAKIKVKEKNNPSALAQGQKSVTNKSKIQDNEFVSKQRVHPMGVLSATNKVKKSFNFDTDQTGSIPKTDQDLVFAQYEAQKRELFNQLLIHANQYSGSFAQPGNPKMVQQPRVYASKKQADAQLTNQQLLMIQQQLNQKQYATNSVSIDTSNKALLQNIPSKYSSQIQSTKNQENTKLKPTKVTKSVGQSKPPAHAQYFEQASAPMQQNKRQETTQIPKAATKCQRQQQLSTCYGSIS